jgi:hypothetical protein
MPLPCCPAQNKLHRNAGPEDLVATEEMLARITAPGADYSADFVSEFRVFTQELRDFFNAASLADLLNALRPSLDDSGNQVHISLPCVHLPSALHSIGLRAVEKAWHDGCALVGI